NPAGKHLKHPPGYVPCTSVQQDVLMSTRGGRVAIVSVLLAMAGVDGRASDVVPPPENIQARVSDTSVSITWRAGDGALPDAFRLEAGSAPGASDLAIVNMPWNPSRGLDATFAARGVARGVYY